MGKLFKYLPILFILSFTLASVGNTYYPSLNRVFQIISLLLSMFVIGRQKIQGFSKRLVFFITFLCVLYYIIYLSNIGEFLTLFTTYIFPIYCAISLTLISGYNRIITNTFALVIICNLAVLLIEIVTGQVFVTVAEGYEIYLGTPFYHFGLFSDPKGGGFCIALMALFLPKEYLWIYIIAFFETILSGCRTSTILMVVPLLFNIKDCNLKVKLIFGGVIAIIVVYVGGMIDFDPRVIERLFNVFDKSEAGNDERILFINKHLALMVRDYGFFDYIFGRYEYTRQFVGNGAESSILSLLLNGGISLLLVYLAGILYGFKNKQSVADKLSMSVLFLLMFVSGIGGGINSGFIFWLYIFKKTNLSSRDPVAYNSYRYSF